jgi:hypothetical protein
VTEYKFLPRPMKGGETGEGRKEGREEGREADVGRVGSCTNESASTCKHALTHTGSCAAQVGR